MGEELWFHWRCDHLHDVRTWCTDCSGVQMIHARSRALPYGFDFLPDYCFLSLKGTGCVEIIEERALEDHVRSLKENTQIDAQFMN